jgi:hypothetical protein
MHRLRTQGVIKRILGHEGYSGKTNLGRGIDPGTCLTSLTSISVS